MLRYFYSSRFFLISSNSFIMDWMPLFCKLYSVLILSFFLLGLLEWEGEKEGDSSWLCPMD